MANKLATTVPKAMQPAYDAIIAQTDLVCRERLNEEYAALARDMTAVLARKRPSPLAAGRLDIWACGIVSAIGMANFLGDPNQNPHMRTEDLCDAFGVKVASATNKSRQIRALLKIYPFDPRWTLPSQLGQNPLVWMLEIDGIPTDIRFMPLELQEEAYRRGFIPYIPALHDAEGGGRRP